MHFSHFLSTLDTHGNQDIVKTVCLSNQTGFYRADFVLISNKVGAYSDKARVGIREGLKLVEITKIRSISSLQTTIAQLMNWKKTYQDSNKLTLDQYISS